ncbi:MAG TPA: helix-turn-helix transcriptional regulator [Pirellulales bacterium]|nr:helix-turn-helix transcriptional regulator [Pirellulales bacterium]
MTAEKQMTHQQLAERKRQIALTVEKEKLTAREAAESFGVSQKYVKVACAVHGVRLRARAAPRVSRTLQILADLAEGMPALQIASERNVSRQRVDQIKQGAQRLGLLPKLKRLDADLRKLRAKVDQLEAMLGRREAERAPRIAADMDGASKSFAVCLRHHREAAGLFQAQAAALAGMTEHTWWTYEAGYRKNPQLDQMVRMAAALGVPVVDLLRDLPAPASGKKIAWKLKTKAAAPRAPRRDAKTL